ncbi:MAG: oligosaccharide flippase family protein [Candidatus Shapirobacteria bacterium]
METLEIEELKQKTTKNMLFVSLRNMGIQAISTLGFFLLSLLLGTGEVGLFALVAESIGILGYFSDIGLTSALIQQKEEVSKNDLRTTFTIQQLLVLISLIVVFLVYPNFSLARNYGSKELWIVLSLCFSFITASLKTIPSVLLERRLNFKLLSIIDILENISFYAIAVIFAFLGFGAVSYAIAIFFRSFLGVFLIYRYSSWPIGFGFSKLSAKRLFKFGIPFQLNSFIAMAKDRLSNVFVGGILGRESFGILSWAQKGPRIPLALMDAIMKVTFPTFARLQEHPEVLQRSLKRSLYFIALFVFPMLAGIALVSSDIINIIPKYQKWLPAVFPLYFYAVNAAIAAVTTPITNAFNAIGKITVTTKLMIMWTTLTWLLFPFFSIKFGYVGTSIATLIVGLSSVVVWILCQKIFNVNVLSTIIHPSVSTLLMAGSIIIFARLNLPLPFPLLGKIIVGITVYLAYHLIFSRPQLSWFFDQLKKITKK